MIILPEINPIMFSVGFINIRWYGFMYVLGLVFAWILGVRCIKDKNLNKSEFADLISYFALGMILGGRIGYMLFYKFSIFLASPLLVFEIWKGGMSFHGGLCGALVSVFIFCKTYEKDFMSILDLIAPLVPPGIMFGRIGNFINGELYGRVTNVSWAMVFPNSDLLPRHPSQLYEMFGEGVLLFLLLSWHKKNKGDIDGLLGVWFLIHYAWIRFFLEFFREPDWDMGYICFNFLTMGQVLCFLMFLTGLVMLVYKKDFFNFRHNIAIYLD